MPRKLKSAALRSDAVTVTNIPDGEITSAKLSSTGVTAGSYGSSSAIPVLTVDDKGRVTALSTSALPTGLATETYVNTQINNLIAGAPGALNTLDELAAALNDDASYATTITNALAAKANTSSLGSLATRNTVNASYIDDASISSTKLASSGRMTVATAARTSAHGLGGDSGWVDHLSVTFTVGVASRIMMVFCESCTYESGAVTAFGRFLVDGNKVGYNFMLGKQSTANSGAAGSGLWYADVSAGSHTVMVQVRNSAGGTTWYTPYWSVDGEVANTLGVWYYS